MRQSFRVLGIGIFANQLVLTCVCSLLLLFTASGQKNDSLIHFQSVFIESDVIPNFYKVSDSLFRSAQPNSKALETMQQNGILSVLNFRSVAGNRKFGKSEHISFNQIRINTWRISEADMLESFKLYQQLKKPVLVHCKHGADRTGAFVAFYRIIYQGWTKEATISELRYGGFGFHERYFQNIINLIETTDFESFVSKLSE